MPLNVFLPFIFIVPVPTTHISESVQVVVSLKSLVPLKLISPFVILISDVPSKPDIFVVPSTLISHFAVACCFCAHINPAVPAGLLFPLESFELIFLNVFVPFNVTTHISVATLALAWIIPFE